MRKEILAKEGSWKLIVLEKEQRATVVKKILRQARELSLAEAMNLKKKMPGSVFVGTKCETYRLRHLLAAYSNPCRSRKFFTPPQPSPNSRSGSKKFTNDLGLL